MRLVTHYIDPDVAADAKSRLCEAGILTELASVDPHVIQPSKSGAERIGLWVVSDDQFEDALLLLANPDHIPQRKTTEPDIEESILRNPKRILKALQKFFK